MNFSSFLTLNNLILCLIPCLLLIGFYIFRRAFLNLTAEQSKTQVLMQEQSRDQFKQLELNLSQAHYELREKQLQGQNELQEKLSVFQQQQQQQQFELQQIMVTHQQNLLQQMEQLKLNTLQFIQQNFHQQMQDTREQLFNHLAKQSEHMNLRIDKLIEQTQNQLQTISGHVNERLNEGFEKTTATFTDVLKRLAIIDEAQKRITELSTNVVSLQEILSDKRSRGAFGEVQLTALIRNVMPENHFELQATLSNGKRVDCLLLLPEPTGNIAIDAKFPLETYRRLTNSDLSANDRKLTEQQFRQDVKKHILDIADKYIIVNETSVGAIMFLPAESVFAEIHAHYPDLIELAHKHSVWIASPTTMMAILTTARSVLKDADTKKQIHLIQEHLGFLAKDFERFQKRMDNLAKHIEQAHDDVKDVNTSANKITNRFRRIESVQLENAEPITRVEDEILLPSIEE